MQGGKIAPNEECQLRYGHGCGDGVGHCPGGVIGVNQLDAVPTAGPLACCRADGRGGCGRAWTRRALTDLVAAGHRSRSSGALEQ